MGYMQVYRVGGEKADSPMRKISQLLVGEGIDCEDLGDQRPDTGCVLIDLTAGEEQVRRVEETVPQLPQILVTSTQTLGSRQLQISDEFVSSDMKDEEIIRRVQCMQNMALRIAEEVPEPARTRILIDGETEGEDASLKPLADVLAQANIEWEPLEDETDRENTGIIYTLYRRLSYARLLQSDYPGYIHIQMAPTPELRVEALTIGDISYLPRTKPEDITVRHIRFLHMLERLRNPEEYRKDPLDTQGLSILFVGDRNVGNSLRNRLGEGFNLKTLATTAGGLAEARKHRVVLIYLGAKEDAKSRLAFLQLLLKEEHPPALCLFFLKSAPDQIRDFCTRNGVGLIETSSPDKIRQTLLELKPRNAD